MSTDPPRLTRSGRDFAEPLLPNTRPPQTQPGTRRRALPNRTSLPPSVAGEKQQNPKSSKSALKKEPLALNLPAASQLPATQTATNTTRLRTLPHRNSLPPRAIQQQIAKTPQKQEAKQKKAAQLPQKPLAATPLPPAAQAPSTYFTDTSTATKLRSLPHRTGSPDSPAYRQKRPPRKPKEPESQQRAESPPRKLPADTIYVASLISVEDLEKEENRRKAAMPVALRRPSTSHRRGLSDKENRNTRPNSKAAVVTNALPNGHSPRHINAAAHAHNQALTNGSLPESTHTHPSQTHPRAQPPSRSEEIDREKALERNIDSVVFGDVMFKAWYPSWYPKEIIGEKGLDGKGTGIVVQKLYVCKKCFGYGKEVHEWARHCQLCQKEIPGRRIYMHGGDGEKDGVWSVWEVDGGIDTIFCQNLSLFAKLFLDNKSVFFDVAGFNYFLLVHNLTSQIIGFFSKEKMSWDNNNLACILIFPPWQRKGLGSILMGVSYEISRREEILGGPEKPISDMGKKGYKMFWGREIARWLLEAKETDRKKGKGMVTVGDVSRGTWIHGEDCLGVLREMGVVERAGKGRGEVERVLLDKEKVRQWVEKLGLGLERVVDREGFVEGYGYKEVVEEEAGD